MVWPLSELRYQFYWYGNSLRRYTMLVCPRCYDRPSEQARAKLLSPDPLPRMNPRPENFVSEMYGGLSAAESAQPVTPEGPVILD